MVQSVVDSLVDSCQLLEQLDDQGTTCEMYLLDIKTHL